MTRGMAHRVPLSVATGELPPAPRWRMSRRRLWKSVQFPLLRELLGGYETARRVHFFAMAGLVAFFWIHVGMVALVPRTLRAMVRGR